MMPNVVLSTCMRQGRVLASRVGRNWKKGDPRRNSSERLRISGRDRALESASQMEVRPRMASKWEAFSERP